MIEQNPGEDLDAFRKRALTKARITSVILGSAAVVAVLFMIYGLTQSIEVQRQKDIAIANERMIIEAKREVAALKEQLIRCESEKATK